MLAFRVAYTIIHKRLIITLKLYYGYVVLSVMTWQVEYTGEFGDWWDILDEDEQDSVAVYVRLLEQKGTALSFPYSSGEKGSKYSHMRELRVQHKGNQYRILDMVQMRAKKPRSSFTI